MAREQGPGGGGTGPEDVRVGATLRELREARGLRVGELARRLGISHCYVSNIEAGRRRLTEPLAVRAAKVLRVRQAALITPDEQAARSGAAR